MKQHRREQAREVVKAGYDWLGHRHSMDKGKFDSWKQVNAFTALLPGNFPVAIQ